MTDADSTKLVWGHISDIGTCMMVTQDGDKIRARPMAGLARPLENAIWFFTARNTPKEGEVKIAPSACLTYADTKGQTFVSVSGQVSVVRDRAKIDELWSGAVEFYFPKGKDDPAIELLRFEPEIAEYWDAPSSPILLAIKFVKSKLTGERPELGVAGTARFA